MRPGYPKQLSRNRRQDTALNMMSTGVLLSIICLLLAFSSAFLAVGCSTKAEADPSVSSESTTPFLPTPSPTPRLKESELSSGLVSAPLRLRTEILTSLNPLINNTSGLNILAPLLWRSLFVNNASGEAVPDLVASYSFTIGGREISLRLKPGAEFSDGSPITVEDVVVSLQTILKREDRDDYGLSNIDSVNGDENSGVRLRLKEADPYIMSRLIFPVLPANRAADNSTEEIPTSGIWRIENWEPGIALNLRRNHSVFVSEPEIEEIHVVMIADQTLAMRALDADMVDLVYLYGNVAEQYWRRASLSKIPADTYCYAVFLLNRGAELAGRGNGAALGRQEGSAALADQALYEFCRRIIAEEIDRAEWLSDYGIFPNPLPVKRDFLPFWFSEKVYTAGGISNGTTINTIAPQTAGLTIIPTPNDSDWHTLLIGRIVSSLEDAGIPVQIEMPVAEDYYRVLEQGDYDIALTLAFVDNCPDGDWIVGGGLEWERTAFALYPQSFPDQRETHIYPLADWRGKFMRTVINADQSGGENLRRAYIGILTKALEVTPCLPIGEVRNCLALGMRMRGRGSARAENILNVIEDMWVWSGE